MAFSALGYDSVHHGHGQWNGVAILSRVGIDDVTTGFDAEVVDPYEGDARLLAATCGGVRVVSVVRAERARGRHRVLRPQARVARASARLARRRPRRPTDPIVVLGDFNVAPEDRDVWSPKAFDGLDPRHRARTRRRAAASASGAWSTRSASCYADDRLFTYWDYRRGDFHQHRGMRIDLALVTEPLAERITWAVVDRNARKGKLPSDQRR